MHLILTAIDLLSFGHELRRSFIEFNRLDERCICELFSADYSSRGNHDNVNYTRLIRIQLISYNRMFLFHATNLMQQTSEKMTVPDNVDWPTVRNHNYSNTAQVQKQYHRGQDQ